MRKFLLLAVLAVLLPVAAAVAGPVVLDGTALNSEFGGISFSGTNFFGWFYMQKALENLAGQVSTNSAKVVVDLGTTGGSPRNAIDSAFAFSTLPSNGWTIVHLSEITQMQSFLATLLPTTTGILYIPTASLSAGDLSDAQLSLINSNATRISNYLNLGGAIFAMGESPGTSVDPFGWLKSTLPGLQVVNLGAGGLNTPLSLTAAGMLAFPGLSSQDVNGLFIGQGLWNNYFTGNLGALSVFATGLQDTDTRNVILGGNIGQSVTPPTEGEKCIPETFASAHSFCITRDTRFWFTHPVTNDDNCVTLLRAIEAAGGRLCLGFAALPVDFENSDNVKDAQDALIEALGFYYRSPKRTGEGRGIQDLKLPASSLCRARKQLAVELIAAIANNALLGTSPADCSYFNGTTVINFPSDLIEQAGAANQAEDPGTIRSFTALLREFNRSGVTNNFVNGNTECSPLSKKTLRKASRDPTTRFSCPGLNDDFFTAEAITTFPFNRTVDLNRYTNSVASPTCDTGGQDVVYKIPPEIGLAGSHFTVRVEDSNFGVVLSLWKGTTTAALPTGDCLIVGIGSTNALTFTVNGTDTYFIVAEGVSGATGNLKLRVTSP